MKFLFTDIIPNATITATEQSTNYPASNIAHVFMKKRYQCLVDSDTITCTFTESQELDCFYWGFHNATSLVFRLKDSGGTTLHTETVSSPGQYAAVYFSAVSGVVTIEIDIAGPSGVYIGKISSGFCYDSDDPQGDFDEPMTDNSVVTTSAGGQTLQAYITPLLGFSCVIPDQTRSKWLEFRELYRAKGKGATLWFDPFWDGGTYSEPMYCAFVDEPSSKKNGTKWDVSFLMKESR